MVIKKDPRSKVKGIKFLWTPNKFERVFCCKSDTPPPKPHPCPLGEGPSLLRSTIYFGQITKIRYISGQVSRHFSLPKFRPGFCCFISKILLTSVLVKSFVSGKIKLSFFTSLSKIKKAL